MNKVVSIEIASQVFWIDEDAYQTLKDYLKQIRQQLASEEFADDIFSDIELRVAELLYGLRSDEKKAVTRTQINEVIEQVGFINGEISDEEIPRRAYRDQQNKILAGVCSGLSQRLRVPAFILRVIFLALSVVFGLGVVLYLIFWISLSKNTSRADALSAQGKRPTASEITQIKPAKESPLFQVQRVIFLPFSILGALLTVFTNHFKKRKQGYFMIIKNLFAIGLVLLSLLLFSGIYEFNRNQLFSDFTAWILSGGVIYLIVVGLMVYIREYYLPKPVRPVDKKLKRGALVPVTMIIAATIYLNYTHKEHAHELVDKTFNLQSSQLTLAFVEHDEMNDYAGTVRYRIKTHKDGEQQVNLAINYSSNGITQESARENIKAVDYFYTFDKDVLKLDHYWNLKQDALRRGQDIEVTIEVPQGITLNSRWPLVVKHDNDGYQYYTRYYWSKSKEEVSYLSSGEYLHEIGETYRNKLSDNERQVLNDKFCEEFFISESWGCPTNIRNSVTDNYRFDRAFMNDSQGIDQIREFLQPDRSLFVSNLTEIERLINEISIEYAVKGEFHSYVEHLIAIKAQDDISLSLADR
ncbi:PspC domain-containing protein [Aliikangiella marina]|uniref:PspC domain-containing protein n=1 Tax=Aliikangiella marina TaxID=1712262 RepID=UPI00163DDD31|nr:PspC domain-containing protein [Aliikangiella marina]